MMNLKKVGCMLIAGAMMVSMFAGCGTQKTVSAEQDTVSSQETDAVQLANEDGSAVKKTSQEVAQERIAARLANSDSSTAEKTSQEIAKERMAARKAAESKPTEPAEKETEQATEPTATTPETTEPVVSMQNNPSAGASSNQKPAESAQTQPKATEPAPTEPAPTEPKPTEPVPTEPAPTEPEKEYIDIAALEEYGRQYAASLGFIPNASLTMDNSSYFPCLAETFPSMDDARWDVAGYIQATYNELMAADGTIEGAGCNVCIIDRGDGTYFIIVLYG